MKIPTKNCIALLTIISVITSFSSAHSVEKLDSVYFNNLITPSDTSGRLNGIVKYAQSSIIPSINRNKNDTQPKLVGMRDTLVLFKPISQVKTNQPLWAIVKDKNNKSIYYKPMTKPENIGRHVNRRYFIDGNHFDYKIDTLDELNQLATRDRSNQKQANPYLIDILSKYSKIKVSLTDDTHVNEIVLPRTAAAHQTKVVIENTGNKATQIHLGGTSANPISLTKDVGKLIANNHDGIWYVADETFSDIRYGEFWSVRIPAQYIEQGMKLLFLNDGKHALTPEIPMVGESQLLVNNIAIGMLTKPRETYDFTENRVLQRNYFQTIPVTRMIVSEYEPVHLTKIMMPWGDLYTDAAPDEGGIHRGEMRHLIGQQLISKAINNANYGLNSTDPLDTYRAGNQITAHTSIGKYANGIRVHGNSGSNSTLSLYSTIGNEWSHQFGHNYGVQHNPGGIMGTKHRGPNQVNSTWGWDKDQNQFITNFTLRKPMSDNCYGGECNPAFRGALTYNQDAMSGGRPVYPLGNAYTLHTPFALNKIQTSFTNKFNFHAYSDTGFTKWNDKTQLEEEYTHIVPKPIRRYQASHTELLGNKLSQAILDYDLIDIDVDIKATNSVTEVRFSLPNQTKSNSLKSVHVTEGANYRVVFERPGLHDYVVEPSKKGESHYLVARGNSWYYQETAPIMTQTRKPIIQGAKVVTVYGYYDPEGKLPTYIYEQPLYGSYGMLYPNDKQSLKSDKKSCRLAVRLRNGAYTEYALMNKRLRQPSEGKEYMNKFHVNFPQSNPPQRAWLWCNGEVLDVADFIQQDKSIATTAVIQGIKPYQQNNINRKRKIRGTRSAR